MNVEIDQAERDRQRQEAEQITQKQQESKRKGARVPNLTHKRCLIRQ